MTKNYDAAYFEKWYRSSRNRVHSHDEVRRKIVLAVATAEYFLQRRIESVLDVGCGEGAWLTHLRPLRPRISYTGLDSSEYAIRRFGKKRNIGFGTFGTLGKAGLRKRYDLVVCSDVLHYLDDDEVRKGLPQLVRLTGGVAYIEVLTKEDSIVGDLEGLTQRPARWYKKTFQQAGLAQVGPYLWLGTGLQEDAGPMEQT
jgi:SAM-dependent methyltransferase